MTKKLSKKENEELLEYAELINAKKENKSIKIWFYISFILIVLFIFTIIMITKHYIPYEQAYKQCFVEMGKRECVCN